MNNGGDAAEQVVRLSLEGIEVAAKLTGSAAKEIAILLASVLKRQTKKSKGKTRLTNMIRSGKPLKVFSIQNKDLKCFVEQAKRYGILYNVLYDKKNQDPNASVDIIARAEDAAKIHRIAERFHMSEVDEAVSVTTEVKEKEPPQTDGQKVMREAMGPQYGKELDDNNPFSGTRESPSENTSAEVESRREKKESVKVKLNRIQKEIQAQRAPAPLREQPAAKAKHTKER